MFFVYSLNLKTLEVTLHSSSHTKDQAEIQLHDAAVQFIRVESGEKRSEDPFRDGTPDAMIKEDGYFLRHSESRNGCIEVYQRKTTVVPGWIGYSVTTSTEQILVYAITEASMGLPIQKANTGMKKPILPNAKQTCLYDTMINELKETLAKKRKLTPTFISVPQSPLNDSSETENPEVRLRRLLDVQHNDATESSESSTESEIARMSEYEYEYEYEYNSSSSSSDKSYTSASTTD